MMQVQKFSLLKRRNDLTREAFSRYWRNEHGPLLAALPEFWKNNIGYIQNHLLPLPVSMGKDAPYDGIAQTIQRPRDNYQVGFFEEPSYSAVVRPDELKFLSVPDSMSVYGREHVIKDGPRTAVKFISFMRKIDGMDFETFVDYWRNRHAPLVEDVKPFWRLLRRYVQNHGMPELTRSFTADGKPEPFCGVAELWFDSAEAAARAFSEPEYLERVRPDEGRFIAKPSMRFLVTEHWVEQPNVAPDRA